VADVNRLLTIRLEADGNLNYEWESVVSTISHRAIRFIGRSYLAFVLTPEAPIAEWLAQMDGWLARSPGFFSDRSIVLDLINVKLSRAGITHLLASLLERNIRVMGLEGIDPTLAGPDLPPLLRGGRLAETPEIAPPARSEPTAAPVPKQPTSLVLDRPVRSGQSIVFPEGDVSVLGSLGSGAEIIAGGSVHIYGTLRGRVMAGSMGNTHARIFCQKIEAELLAIGGYYRTAEEIDQTVRGQPTQAWLEGRAIIISALN
jgi:septum site-determining protein MinC